MGGTRPFSGHFNQGDPRSNLFCAGGCVWPTVPAVNYMGKSDNATGVFFELNQGIPIYLLTPITNHDSALWNMTGLHEPIIFFGATKVIIDDPERGYTWNISFEVRGWLEVIFKSIEFPISKCNRNVPVGNMDTGSGKLGETGDSFRLEQLPWDYPLDLP